MNSSQRRKYRRANARLNAAVNTWEELRNELSIDRVEWRPTSIGKRSYNRAVYIDRDKSAQRSIRALYRAQCHGQQ